ncbi:secreted RxLR effector protein 161-like [Culex quinquefasciatus]|uniref:secreted RxLR effector protein 161-like n=1 Tax=Culex quinquefasciatus TaxID=7176 RepID=UPI0018E2A64D|nr:secreted RxLR effector protein 161-like [Culex quinquefasciatus]
MAETCTGLKTEFELTDLGEVRHFLGVEVKRESDVYKLSLKNYTNKLLKDFGMEQCKAAKTPMDPAYLKVEEAGEEFTDSTKYRSLVGGLLYLAVVARPDIAAAAAILGRRFSAPRECDWTAAKRVLRYLQGTQDYRLQLGGDKNQDLVGFSDADWAGDAESRRSTSGMLFQYGGGSITWASRRQPP